MNIDFSRDYEFSTGKLKVYQGIVLHGTIHLITPFGQENITNKLNLSPVPWKILPNMDVPEGISFSFITHENSELLDNGWVLAGFGTTVEPLLTFERIK